MMVGERKGLEKHGPMRVDRKYISGNVDVYITGITLAMSTAGTLMYSCMYMCVAR